MSRNKRLLVSTYLVIFLLLITKGFSEQILTAQLNSYQRSKELIDSVLNHAQEDSAMMMHMFFNIALGVKMSNQNYQGLNRKESIFMSLNISKNKTVHFQIALPVEDEQIFKNGFSNKSVLFKKWSLKKRDGYIVILSNKDQALVVQPHHQKLSENLIANIVFNQRFLEKFSENPQLYELGPLQPLLETVHLNTKSHLGADAKVKEVTLELEKVNGEMLKSNFDIRVQLKKGEHFVLESIKANVVHSNRLLGLGLATNIQQLLLKGLSF